MKGFSAIVLLGLCVVLQATITSSMLVPGGPKRLDVDSMSNDAEFQGLVNRAVDELNREHLESGDTRERELVEVVSATTQIVQGVRYELTLKLRIKPDAGFEECDIAVWYRPFHPDNTLKELYTIGECRPVHVAP